MNLKDLDPGQRALLIHHTKPAKLPETATPQQIENNRRRVVVFLVERPRYPVLEKPGKTIVDLLERVSYPPHPDDREYNFVQNASYTDTEVGDKYARVRMIPIGDTDEVVIPNRLGESLVLHVIPDAAYCNPSNLEETGKKIAETDKITRRLQETPIS